MSPSLASYTPPALASVPKTPTARRASELEFDNNTNIALNRKSRVLHGAPHGFYTAPPRNSHEIHTPSYTESTRNRQGFARNRQGYAEITRNTTRKSHGKLHGIPSSRQGPPTSHHTPRYTPRYTGNVLWRSRVICLWRSRVIRHMAVPCDSRGTARVPPV